MQSDLYPDRSVSELEGLANELNSNYFTAVGRSLSVPIPIEDIAEHFLGYSIDITDEGLFSDPDFLGGIDFDQNLIYVNASVEAHDGRYAFTVAHEIGHHTLHKEAFLLSNEYSEKGILCRDTKEKPRIEVEADRFAAALLMPSDVVLEAVHVISPKPKVNSIGQARGLASKLINEGQFSNVSNSAMINRLIDLKLVPEFVGYQNGQFRKGRRRPSLSMMVHRTLSKIRFWS